VRTHLLEAPVAEGWKEEVVPVEVRLPTVLRPHAGGQTIVSARGATIGEVLADLTHSYPAMAGQLLTDDGTLHRFVNVYVNDDDVRYLDKLDTKVAEGDTVSILPAVAGG
jgi:sulfur-carrier protein